MQKTTKNNKLIALGLITASGLTNIAIADVPNSFTAGSPAKASEVNENFINLDTRVTAVESTSTSNATNVTNANSRIVTLETDTAATNSAVTSLDARTTSVESTSASNTLGLDTLEGRVTNTESSVTNATANIGNLAGRVSSLESSTAATDSTVSNIDTRTSAVESESAANTSELNILEPRVTSVESDQATANSNISNIDSRTTTLESTASSNSAEIFALDTRITSLESNSGSSVDYSGFSLPFAADGSPRNVVLSLSVSIGGNRTYFVRSRYANSSETISVNGTPTVRPFIANFASIETDINGTILQIDNYIEAPETLSYTNSVTENSTYDPISLIKTVTSDNQRERYECSGAGSIAQCVVIRTEISSGNFIGLTDWSRIQTVVSGPFTVAPGITFAQDMRHESYISANYSRSSMRLRARGIGEVFRQPRRTDGSIQVRNLIYFRVDGQTGGSLIGTPFASGQPLDGLFF